MKVVPGSHWGIGLAHKDLEQKNGMLTRLGKTAGIEPIQTVDVPPLTERTALHDIATTHASWPKNQAKCV